MAAFVQVANGTTGGGTATSVAAVYGSNNTLGNFLVCCVRGFSAAPGVLSVADTQTNTWVKAAGDWVDNPGGVQNEIQTWYVTNCKAGANTVTLSTAGSAAFLRIIILEYSGIALSSPEDGNSHGAGSSTSWASGNITTTATDLLIGNIQDENANPSFTPTGGWTLRKDTGDSFAVYDQLNQVAGTYGFSGTVGSSSNWAAMINAFKNASVVVPVFPRSILQKRTRFYKTPATPAPPRLYTYYISAEKIV
jgi:hypothetical protein